MYKVIRHSPIYWPRRARCPGSPGFALIITLVLMIIVVVVAVGLLSLASISLRTHSRERDMQTARANARLALMLAIGELQMELGPDQRITATSGILSPPDTPPSPQSRPWLTGVWNSRNDVLSASYRPDYDRAKSFRRWLVSVANPQAALAVGFPDSGTFKDPVTLVGGMQTSGANAVNYPAVDADRLPVTAQGATTRGKLAWWVGDENCKGFSNPTASPAQQANASVSDILASSNTPGAHGMQAVDDGYPTNTAQSSKAVTHGEIQLASTQDRATSNSWFHDLSPYSRSLLCNVAKGGLRQDLSLFLEQSSLDTPPQWPSSGPVGPLGPNGKIALSNVDEFDVLSWKSLAAWSRLRKNVNLVGGRPTLRSFDGSGLTAANEVTNPSWNTGALRPAPVLIRALLFISYGTIQDPADATKLAVRLYTYPVLTFWNPYNVDIELPLYNMLFTAMPMEHQIKLNGTTVQSFDWRNGTTGNGIQPFIRQTLRLKAGEAKMLTPTQSGQWAWKQQIHLAHDMGPEAFNFSPGFPGGEWGNRSNTRSNSEQEITIKGIASDRVEIKTLVSFKNAYTANYRSTFDIRGQHSTDVDGAWPTYLWSTKLAWRFQAGGPSPDKLNQAAPPSESLGNLKNNPRPFMVMDAKLKALDEDEFPNKTWSDCIPGHGFQGCTDTGDLVTPVFATAYKLTFEPINSYQEASSYLQIAADDPAHTYFGGSHFPQGGQSLITDVEIPMAPLSSLAQLQHLPQASIDNLYSSGFFMQNHAIGNSFASPGVPANGIVNTSGWPFWVDMYLNNNGGTISGAKLGQGDFITRPNIDRSYAANFLLWDDYFLSSIAPKDSKLTTGGQKTIDAVIKDFYQNNKPLGNERYRPYLYKPASQITADLATSRGIKSDAHLKSAASLVVDGGFNINSVSVNAWKTLLASANKRPMAVLANNGKPPALDPEGKFIVSRLTMPNGSSADAATGQSRDALRWQGYRELTEPQIDALAKAIVRQVKTRGPFRSLGEFINRRLAAESDAMSLSGALQAALDDPSVDINAPYNTKLLNASSLVNPITKRKISYPNMTAATGSRYQGSPACVTQADLLGPIAPILNARSDTFVVRGYGEATDEKGNPTARAWCEAVVQRVPDFLDAANTPDTALNGLNAINKKFGRKFIQVSFRWLNDQELRTTKS